MQTSILIESLLNNTFWANRAPTPPTPPAPPLLRRLGQVPNAEPVVPSHQHLPHDARHVPVVQLVCVAELLQRVPRGLPAPPPIQPRRRPPLRPQRRHMVVVVVHVVRVVCVPLLVARRPRRRHALLSAATRARTHTHEYENTNVRTRM